MNAATRALQRLLDELAGEHPDRQEVLARVSNLFGALSADSPLPHVDTIGRNSYEVREP